MNPILEVIMNAVAKGYEVRFQPYAADESALITTTTTTEQSARRRGVTTVLSSYEFQNYKGDPSDVVFMIINRQITELDNSKEVRR